MVGRVSVGLRRGRAVKAMCLFHALGLVLLGLISVLEGVKINEALVFCLAVAPPAGFAAVLWQRVGLGIFADLRALAPVVQRPFRPGKIALLFLLLAGLVGVGAAIAWPGVPSGLATEVDGRYFATQHSTKVAISRSQFRYMNVRDNVVFLSTGLLLDALVLAVIYVIDASAAVDSR